MQMKIGNYISEPEVIIQSKGGYVIKIIKSIVYFIKDLNTFCDVYIEEVMGDY